MGRDRELSSLSAFFDRDGSVRGPIAIALEGDAGIGKSTLWRDRGRGRARARLARALLAARGVRARARPRRPRRPLRRRARRGPADADAAAAPGARSGAADRGRGRAPRRPAGARRRRPQRARAPRRGRPRRRDRRPAVARRVVRDRARVRAAASAATRSSGSCGRGGSARPEQSTAVAEALDPDRIERIDVGPLSVGAIHRILHDRLSRPAPRPTLLRLHEASARQSVLCARARAGTRRRGLGARPDAAAAGARAARRARLRPARRLRAATREALALASADARLTPAQLGAGGIERDALDPALDERVIELARRHDSVHAPAARLGALPGTGRGRAPRIHRRLAGLVGRPARPGAASRALRRHGRTPSSPPRSSRRPRPPPTRGRRSPQPSSPSTRSA